MLKIFLSFIAPGSIIIPITVFIMRFTKVPSYAKWIFTYLIFSAVLNITAIIIARVFHLFNLWLFHINTITESFLLLQYFQLIITNATVKSVIRVLKVAFPLFCIINFLFLQSLAVFNTYTRPVEAIIFIALCMVYWWQANDEDTDLSWGSIANNWIVTGLMLYFAGAFFLFLFSNYMLSSISISERRIAMDIAWITHGAFVIIMYLLFAIGFIKCKK